MKPISNCGGVTPYEIKKFEEYENKIKSEIMQVFKEHNLTLGEARDFLDKVKRDLATLAYQNFL